MARGIEVHNGQVILSDIVSMNLEKDIAAAYTGNLIGLRSNVGVAAAIALTGQLYGAYVRSYIGAGGSVTGDGFGLYILVQWAVAPDSVQSAMIRLEANGAAVIHSVIQVMVAGGGDISFFARLNPADRTGWSPAGDKTVRPNAGWLRLLLGATQERYIQLYEL